MEVPWRSFYSWVFLLLFASLQIVVLMSLVTAEESDSFTMSNTPIIKQEEGYHSLVGFGECSNGQEQNFNADSSGGQVDTHRPAEDVEITATYTDVSGATRVSLVKARDLSASWVWENGSEKCHEWPKVSQGGEGSLIHVTIGSEDTNRSFMNKVEPGEITQHSQAIQNPVKLMRRQLRKKRKEMRTAELVQQGKEAEDKMQVAAIERSKQLDTTVQRKYSIWRREYEHSNSDATLKLMRDQIIMAKAFASIARSKNLPDLHNSLMQQIKESQHAISGASSDAEVHRSALERAKAMGHVLSTSRGKLYDCSAVSRKLRVMLQMNEERIDALKKKSLFLTQLAAKTVPKGLHCLPLLLATDYFLQDPTTRDRLQTDKLEDLSLYHYAMFSDNVLAASVVVNSTILNAKEPDKHVFHIVTDKLNFAAMKMWFLANVPPKATIHVQNFDDFKWLNSSYCPVLRQLESAALREYYFKSGRPSTLSAGDENLKYRNPKYLSMLNHLRFYLPQIYPKLDKILFLDDDVVVQKDLTALWSIDLQGKVNGAVETCRETFHRFDKYLNFSNPVIAQNFDPKACGWAFGMNMFDLKEWTKRDMTAIYHRWQGMNEDRTLWQLGSLPPGLMTFYNLTYPLNKTWHVLGLGYDPSINQSEIENAGVIHYNGNNKPWLELANVNFKPYWSKYVEFDNPYLRLCNVDL